MNLDASFGSTRQFDCILIEASLAHYARQMKQDFGMQVAQYTSQILVHEVPVASHDYLSRYGASAENWFLPETTERYQIMLEQAEFDIQQLKMGPVQVLHSPYIVHEEELAGAVRG